MRVAIYARKSTEDEGESTLRQVEHGQAYAERKGWTVLTDHIYQDDNISGAEFDRPGLARLMGSLKPTPPYQALVISEGSRLGREQLESGFLLKQLSIAGVSVWSYLDDKQLVLDTPVDKIMLSLTAFADELERHKAQLRTYDALLKKAKAGHATGNRCYGYDNREIKVGDLRSHVERTINESEAEVIREIFRMAAAGLGITKIAKQLNSRGISGPRGPWAPSSVREILYRDLYRGLLVWGKIKKRDKWGQRRYLDRPQDEWTVVKMPHLRIVDDELWRAVHQRLAASRSTYLRQTDGKLWGRPTRGLDSRYLLTGMGQCSVCGGSMIVVSSGAKDRRIFTYKCANYHNKGKTVCPNGLTVPLGATDQAVLSAIEEQALQPEVVEKAIDRALEMLRPAEDHAKLDGLNADLVIVQSEIDHLTKAVATGGDLPSLVAAIKEREQRKTHIESELRLLDELEKMSQVDMKEIEEDLWKKLSDWRGLLQRQNGVARQILRKLLLGRLIFEPHEDDLGKYYVIRGQCSFGKLLSGVVFKSKRKNAAKMVTPAGFEPALPP